MNSHNLLEKSLTNPVEAMKRVSHGLEWAEAEQLAEWLDIPMADLGRYLDISPATMTRRKNGRFDQQESDRILRIARLWVLACDAVGGADGARTWLKREQYGLGGAIPLDMVKFETGAREVEDLLRRILYGVLA